MGAIVHRQVARLVTGTPRCHLAESPRWSGDRWWWVDVPRGRVWSATLDSRAPTPTAISALRFDFGVRTSLVQPGADGRILLARASAILDAGDGDPRILAEIPLDSGGLLNDGVLDSHGVLFIGSVGANRDQPEGAIWSVGPSGAVSRFAEGFVLSNGMAWAGDGGLWHADSGTGTVWLHRRDSSGAHAGSDEFYRFDPSEGMPDGLVADGRGGVWVAVYGAGRVVRLDSTARVTHEVAVPAPQVTGVALGGPDGRDLVIATAREGFTSRDSDRDPDAGCMFLARVEQAAAMSH